jgi:hypothetical protein
MKHLDLALPKLGFIVATRAALGAGLGLLAGGKLRRSQRKRAGLALLAVGVLTTIPALFLVRGGLKSTADEPLPTAL